MATVYLPDDHHIVRHIPPLLVERDPDTDEVLGCLPQSFMLREGEDYLSASWLEHFGGEREERLRATVSTFAAVRTVRPRHGFAIGNVLDVKNACEQYRLKIRVCHEPNDNPAHTAIRRYKSDESELLELLSAEAWCDVIEARDYLP